MSRCVKCFCAGRQSSPPKRITLPGSARVVDAACLIGTPITLPPTVWRYDETLDYQGGSITNWCRYYDNPILNVCWINTLPTGSYTFDFEDPAANIVITALNISFSRVMTFPDFDNNTACFLEYSTFNIEPVVSQNGSSLTITGGSLTSGGVARVNCYTVVSQTTRQSALSHAVPSMLAAPVSGVALT